MRKWAKDKAVWIATHPAVVGTWWEKYIQHHIEIGSAVVVVVCDVFGGAQSYAAKLAQIHPFAASGCLVVVSTHLVKRHMARRKRKHAHRARQKRLEFQAFSETQHAE